MADKTDKKVCFALGFFDGVHRGHRALLDGACKLAAANAMRAGVFTYNKHPREILFGESPRLLTTPSEREELFKKCGMDIAVLYDFSKEFAAKTPEEFIEMLVEDYNCGGVCCGENFFFGAGADGDAAILKHICAKKNLVCRVIPQVNCGDKAVSSTIVRQMVEGGKVRDASNALCRPFSLSGRVIHGDARGGKFGIPTLNLPIGKNGVSPKNGVYATLTRIDGELFCGITNVGTRPTFAGGTDAIVENHVLNFSRDIYGESVRIYFCEFLRDEKKFESGDALYAQIATDIEKAEKILRQVDRSGINELL